MMNGNGHVKPALEAEKSYDRADKDTVSRAYAFYRNLEIKDQGKERRQTSRLRSSERKNPEDREPRLRNDRVSAKMVYGVVL